MISIPYEKHFARGLLQKSVKYFNKIIASSGKEAASNL